MARFLQGSIRGFGIARDRRYRCGRRRSVRIFATIRLRAPRRARITSAPDREFNEFVAARFGRLRRFAYFLCGDRRRAEDAVQRAFTKFYLVWRKNNIPSPDAYVRRIVVNDDYRLGFFKRERVSDELPDRSGLEHSACSGDRLVVLAALARLSKRQRTAVLPRYREDLPIEQVAEIMKCTTGAVKSRSSRGLAALRHRIGPGCVRRPDVAATVERCVPPG